MRHSPAVPCPSPVPERQHPTAPETGRDARVTTQVTTQNSPGCFCSMPIARGPGGRQPPAGSGGWPRVEARSAAGLELPVAVAVAVAFACAARSARRGERKPMRWAGAPRALSPTRFLAAGVVGGTCPFSARSFCAGVKPLEGERIFCVAVRLALLGGAARIGGPYRLAAPPTRAPAPAATRRNCLRLEAAWAQNTKNRTRAKRASTPSCGAKRGQSPR
jgi:hypothetical protein